MPAPVPFPGGSRDETRREGGGGQQQVAHDESSTFLLLFFLLLLPFPPWGRRLGEAAPGELGGERRKGRGLLRDPGGWR